LSTLTALATLTALTAATFPSCLRRGRLTGCRLLREQIRSVSKGRCADDCETH